MAKQPTVPITTTPKGIMTALLAFLMWGNFPFYFKLLDNYHAVEVIVHRVVWTFEPCCHYWQKVILACPNPPKPQMAWLDLYVSSTNWHELANLCMGSGK